MHERKTSTLLAMPGVETGASDHGPTQSRVHATSGENDANASSVVMDVQGLSKVYSPDIAASRVLSDLSFQVRRGEFVSLCGPSGVGKTTLLRCLSGMTAPSEGRVLIDGTPVEGPRAEIAIVFQDYSRSLLPWMKVLGNVALPLKSKGMTKLRQRELAMKAIESVGLSHAADLYPWQLSGGMQQRVAIARALAYEPEILLMDEPFASVDAQTRMELEDLVLKIHEESGLTTLLVTHDIDEAVYLSSRVIVLASRPARIADEVFIDFGGPRDQVSTRSMREFSEHRARILTQIRSGAS